MSHSRPERVADQIREEITVLLARNVQDPGVGFITVTRVKVTADLQHARIFYTSMGPEGGDDVKARRETVKALARVNPYLRRQIAQRINLRRAPELEFFYDDTIAGAARIEELLHEVAEERRQYELANPPGDEPAPTEPAEPTDTEPEPQGDGDPGTGDAGRAGQAGPSGSEQT